VCRFSTAIAHEFGTLLLRRFIQGGRVATISDRSCDGGRGSPICGTRACCCYRQLLQPDRGLLHRGQQETQRASEAKDRHLQLPWEVSTLRWASRLSGTLPSRASVKERRPLDRQGRFRSQLPARLLWAIPGDLAQVRSPAGPTPSLQLQIATGDSLARSSRAGSRNACTVHGDSAKARSRMIRTVLTD
jgi:hypothetical protein